MRIRDTRPSDGPKNVVDYPTSDGRPMAETDIHRILLMETIQTLEAYFAADPMTYVSGNILLFYEEGNRRMHVSPDTLVTKGIEKKTRLYYLLWEEGKPPDVAIEITSKTTKKEDLQRKFDLYRDVIKVPEYFLFDSSEDYLTPSLQGYHLVDGEYVPIAPVEGRLPSNELGLSLERVGEKLRFWNPQTSTRLLTPRELQWATQAIADQAMEQSKRDTAARLSAEAAKLESDAARLKSDAARMAAEAAKLESDAARQDAEKAKLESDAARQAVEKEMERMRQELEEFRRRPK
jgi:Uma2 family endonuclease